MFVSRGVHDTARHSNDRRRQVLASCGLAAPFSIQQQMLLDQTREFFAAGLLVAMHQPQRGGDDDFVSVVVLRGHASLLGIEGWLARVRWRAGNAVSNLLRENQFAVLGDARAIVLAVMADQDFLIALK